MRHQLRGNNSTRLLRGHAMRACRVAVSASEVRCVYVVVPMKSHFRASKRPLGSGVIVPPNFLDAVNDGSALAAADQPADVGLAADLQLYHYQRQALQWMAGRERAPPDDIHGGILGDEQGTGKTVMVAALVAFNPCDELPPQAQRVAQDGIDNLPSEARKCGATLICCTPVIEQQWKEELAQHAPGLKVVSYTGCPTAGNAAAVAHEVERLGTADIVLVTYAVLMKELEHVDRSFESNRERRAGLGLRARQKDSDARPSPLKYLTFWRVVLDEVQKAPTSYAAGKTVRLVRAVNRWAVSGTPMEAGRLGDVCHLINFVAGERSQTEAAWKRAAEGGELAELRSVLHPLFLRRTKEQVKSQISVPKQVARTFAFELSEQEKVLHAEFVLPAARAQLDKQPPGASPEQQMVLIEHTQRALLSPALWSEWGRRSKLAVDAEKVQRQGLVANNTATARKAKGVAMELVGELVEPDGPVSSGDDARRRGFVEKLHKCDGVKRSQPLWPSLLSAARAAADSAHATLREAVEKHALGIGELQGADVEALQQLVTLKFLMHHGMAGPPLPPPPPPDAPHADRERAATEEARRRQLTHDALNQVLSSEKDRQGTVGNGRLAQWALSDSNSNGVRDILHRYLGFFPTSDEASSTREAGRPLVPLDDDSVRWADVAPFLALHFEKVEVDAFTLARFRQGIAEMAMIDEAGIVALAQPSSRRGLVTQYMLCLGSELGDLFREREEMRLIAERRLMPDECIRTFPPDRRPAKFDSQLLYGLLGERKPLSDTTDEDDEKLAEFLHGTYTHKFREWFTDASDRKPNRGALVTELTNARDAAQPKLLANRLNRELSEEKARAELLAHVEQQRARYARIKALADAACGPDSNTGDVDAVSIVDAADAADAAAAHDDAAAAAAADDDDAAAMEEEEDVSGGSGDGGQGWEVLSGSSKLAALVKLLEEHVVEKGEKAVVFTQFAEAVPLIGALLRHRGIGAVSLKEGSGPKWWPKEWRDRLAAGRAVEVFKSEPTCSVMVLEAGPAAAGLTLICAQHVVFVDVLNSALLESQAKARVARIGQRAETTAWHLVATDSVDEPLRRAADAGIALDTNTVRSILAA